MYCSLRLFIDKTPDLSDSSNFLNVVELCSNFCNKSIDYLTCYACNVDSDEMMMNKKFNYNEKGIEKFKKTKIISSNEVENRIFTTLCGMKKCDDFEPFSDIRIYMIYPLNSLPLEIYFDFKLCSNNKVSFVKYCTFIRQLNAIGYRVNNSFCYICSLKRETLTLDGIRDGSFITLQGRNNLNSSAIHRFNSSLNRFMNIYYFNSITINALNDKKIKGIIDIVGKENVKVEDDILSFALDSVDNITPLYHLKYLNKIKKLRKLLL